MAHDASDPPLAQDADPQDRRAGRAVFGAFDTTMVLVLGLVCVRVLVAFDRSAEAARLVQLLRRLAPRRFDVLVRRLIERGREEAAAAGDAEQGGDVVGGTPQAFAAYIALETEKWARVVKAANVRAE